MSSRFPSKLWETSRHLASKCLTNRASSGRLCVDVRYHSVSYKYEGGRTNNTARDQTVFAVRITETGDHEQLILNGERFRPAFAERDNKQTIIDLRGNSTNWFKN